MKKILRFHIFIGLLFLFSCKGTFYIVRHGERLNNSDNTPLSDNGFLRAIALADSLQNKGIDSIFVSTKLRSQQTARPLSDRIHEPMVIYHADTLVAFVNRISKLKKNVLIVSHSEQIPTVVQILSGQVIPAIPFDDFDNFYKVTIKYNINGTISRTLLVTHYGAVSP